MPIKKGWHNDTPDPADQPVKGEVEHEEQDVEGQTFKIGRRDETPDPADQAGKGEVAHDEDADDDAEGHTARPKF